MLRRPTIRGFRSGVLLFFVSCRAHRAVTLAQMLCARWNNAVVHPIDIPVDRRGHRQVPARWVAVHTFSGEVGDHSVQEKSEWLIGQVLSSARPSEALGDISSTVISVSPSPRARTAACPALHRTRRSLQGLFRGRFARTATRYTRRRTGRCRPLGAVMRAGGRGSAAADPSRETSRAFARRRGSWRGTTLRSLSRCSRPTRSRKRPPPSAAMACTAFADAWRWLLTGRALNPCATSRVTCRLSADPSPGSQRRGVRTLWSQHCTLPIARGEAGSTGQAE
jgi:hypothetical protein